MSCIFSQEIGVLLVTENSLSYDYFSYNHDIFAVINLVIPYFVISKSLWYCFGIMWLGISTTHINTVYQGAMATILMTAIKFYFKWYPVSVTITK